jgi:hypothetical protein
MNMLMLKPLGGINLQMEIMLGEIQRCILILMKILLKDLMVGHRTVPVAIHFLHSLTVPTRILNQMDLMPWGDRGILSGSLVYSPLRLLQFTGLTGTEMNTPLLLLS